MERPNVATLGEIAHDLECTIQMIKAELSKHRQDVDLLRKLATEASIKSVAVNGLLRYNDIK